jgi:hypothetical protein
MINMKTIRFLPCLAAGVLLSTLSANAHPYASAVTNNNGTIQFILNENATSVSVAFDNGTVTNNLGALAKGSNGFNLGSHTNFAIAVFNIGSGAFTQTSDDSSNAVQFIAPRGVGVNINPQRPNFGRIYVCSAWPSGITAVNGATNATGNGRVVGKGIYLLNQDGSDAIGQGTNALLGNIVLGTSVRYSPYRIFVGPDDSVYVADLAGTYTAALGVTGLSYSPVGGGVWWAAPDFSSTTNLFDTNDVGTVYDGVQGLHVTGSLAASNLVILAAEWTETGFDASANFLTPPAVWQYTYDSVNNPIPIANDPVGLFTVGLAIDGVLGDLAVHPTTGYIYAEQDRTSAGGDTTGTGVANNNNAELYIYDASGVTNIWESGIGGADVFDATYGIAVSPDGNWLACATGYGTVLITHITNGIPDLSTVVTNNEEAGPINTGLVASRRSVVFDAADNVITSLPTVNTTLGYEFPTPSNPSVVREYSLGYTSIATTSNDDTCSNGVFTIVLKPPGPKFTGIIVATGDNVTLTWTSAAADTVASFAVQSTTSLSGTFSDVTGVTITQPGGAGTVFQATVGAQSPTIFYRIRHL